MASVPVKIPFELALPSEWREAFQWLSEYFPVIPQTEPIGETEIWFINAQVAYWLSAMHWVYKKTWDSKHKVPGGYKKAALSRSLGDVFIAIRELCKEVHFLCGEGTNYPHPAAWFAVIVKEDLDRRVALAIKSARSGRSDLTKPQRIALYRKNVLALLKDFEAENPFPNKKHLGTLIDYAKKLAEESDQFYKNYWKPFISACEKLVKHIETHSEFSQSWVENGSIRIQEGRGRGHIRFTPKRKSLEVLRREGFRN